MSQDDFEMCLVESLDAWDVTLNSGELITVFAHAYSQEGNEYIFSMLTEGNPAVDVVLARFPIGIVKTIYSQ
jgi:hypothetical protein